MIQRQIDYESIQSDRVDRNRVRIVFAFFPQVVSREKKRAQMQRQLFNEFVENVCVWARSSEVTESEWDMNNGEQWCGSRFDSKLRSH